MTITNDRINEIALSLFKQQSERDAQKKIGASDFSDPCSYHLAKKLLGEIDPPAKYWMGAKIGTAIHALLEDAITKADLDEIPELATAVVEQKIFLGELDGYGTINSKPDLAFIDGKHLVDWKTSMRAKVKKLKAVAYGETDDAQYTYTLKKYYTQAQIYAWGLNRSGKTIEDCSLVFINRDGTSDSDVWTWTFPYLEAYAQSAWDRLESIWKALQDNPTPEQFERDDNCFKCKVTDPV